MNFYPRGRLKIIRDNEKRYLEKLRFDRWLKAKRMLRGPEQQRLYKRPKTGFHYERILVDDFIAGAI
jgi:hypothetical protein